MRLTAPSEHQEQSALISWIEWEGKRRYPELLTHLFAIPNGSRRTHAMAAWLKAEGMKRGVPDLFLAVARGGFHGLFLEMKAHKGTLSKEQKEWIARLTAAGYLALVGRGYEDARKKLIDYMEMPA